MSICLRTEETKKWNLLRLKNITSAFLGQQIANLVKVLGPEKVIRYVYGNKPIIEFRQQKSRGKIHGSTFEIVSDMVKFDHFYKYKGGDLEDMISKFERKIEEKDLDYFCSQETVISLYDSFQRRGLGKRYAKQLLEIADSLGDRESIAKEPIQFKHENWEYQDYDNSWDDIMEGYRKIANSFKEIDKNRYVEILKNVLSMHKHPYGNMEEMWNLLIKLSRGAADKISRETLEELLQNIQSSWEICNYTHLLREIEECDYFSEQAKNVPEDFEEEF